MQQPSYAQPSIQPAGSSQISRSVQQRVGQPSSVYQGANSIGGNSRLITGGAMSSTTAGPERVQSTRKISSTIVNEQLMGPPPQDYPVREIEVPGPTEEVIKVVPKKMVHETEKRVPKYIYEYVDKIVEVPRVEYVDRLVEKIQYQDVPVPRKVTQYVDVPKEIVKEVKIPKVNYVENVVEVPGPVIPVPKPYNVEQIVQVNQYTDRKRPVIVAQSVRPVILEGAGVTEVDVYEYEPECVPVDVHVLKGVQANIQAGGVVETQHKVISVPSAQYNTILKQMNVHLAESEIQKLPYLQDRNGVAFLGEHMHTTEVPRGVYVAGLDVQNLTHTWVDQASRKVLPVNDSRAQYVNQRQMPVYEQPSARTGSSYNTTSQRISSAGQYNVNATPLQGPSNTASQYFPPQRIVQEQSAMSYSQNTPQPQYTNTQYAVNSIMSYAQPARGVGSVNPPYPTAQQYVTAYQ